MTWAILFIIAFLIGYAAWSMKGRYLLRFVMGIGSTLVLIYAINLATRSPKFWMGVVIVVIALVAFFYFNIKKRKKKERQERERGNTIINIHNGPQP